MRRRTSSGEVVREEPLAPPTPEKVLFAVLSLSHAVTLEMRDEEISHKYLETLRDLFPERRFALRMLHADPRAHEPGHDAYELGLVHATGKLLESRREHVTLSREALLRHQLAPEVAERAGVEATDDFVSIFEEGAAGFDVPLLDFDHVGGVLTVEYCPGVTPPPEDPPILLPLALGLGSALRNAKLLRESTYLRQSLERLLDNANAPILVIGRARELRVFNRAFEKLTGMDRSNVLGTDFVQLLPPEDRTRILPVLIKSLRGEAATDVEVRLPKASGCMLHVALSTAPVMGPDAEIESVIAIGRDLSEVRSLQEQIIQAEKFVTLGQLAAGVVHELNNPLTSISVYAEYLLKKGQRAGQDRTDLDKLGRIVAGADRMLNFTRDLLAYARPSAEEPTLLGIDRVLDESLMFCDHLLEEKGVVVERRFEPDLGPVLAIRSQLHQVFINLVTNACHAMRPGDSRLVIEARSGEPARVIVRLTDNGEGIPSQHLPMIFEPFFTTKPEGKGTGLGLSIVRNILRAHQASVEVTSAPGQGSTFEIGFLSKP